MRRGGGGVNHGLQLLQSILVILPAVAGAEQRVSCVSRRRIQLLKGRTSASDGATS